MINAPPRANNRNLAPAPDGVRLDVVGSVSAGGACAIRDGNCTVGSQEGQEGQEYPCGHLGHLDHLETRLRVGQQLLRTPESLTPASRRSVH